MHHWIRSLSAPTLAVTIALSSLAPRAVFADDAQKAAAEQLFSDAKTLMDLDKFEEACPKLEQSVKLDKGGGALTRLAYCYEKTGRLASAWARYREALALAKLAKNSERITYCEKSIADIEPRLSHVTVNVAKPLSNVVVEWDGQTFVAGTPVPVDGGTHVLTVSAPGKKTWETKLQLAIDKENKVVDVPPLEDASSGSTAAATKGVPTIAYVLVGAGAIFTLGAVGAHVAAVAAHDERRADCLNELATTCDDVGKSKVRTWEALSYVSAGLAVASFGTAIYLYVASPKSEGAAPPSAFIRLAPRVGGLSLEGGF